MFTIAVVIGRRETVSNSVLASLDPAPFFRGNGHGAVEDDVFVLIGLQRQPLDFAASGSKMAPWL